VAQGSAQFDQDHVRLRRDDRGEPLPENLVILDAQDADSLRFAHNVMFSGT
jgi:hypothetical protein